MPEPPKDFVSEYVKKGLYEKDKKEYLIKEAEKEQNNSKK